MKGPSSAEGEETNLRHLRQEEYSPFGLAPICSPLLFLLVRLLFPWNYGGDKRLAFSHQVERASLIQFQQSCNYQLLVLYLSNETRINSLLFFSITLLLHISQEGFLLHLGTLFLSKMLLLNRAVARAPVHYATTLIDA